MSFVGVQRTSVILEYCTRLISRPEPRLQAFETRIARQSAILVQNVRLSHKLGMTIEFPISIMKSLWSRRADGQWQINDIKELELSSGNADEERYFVLRGDVQLMTNSPNAGMEDVLTMIGPTEFLMQQSIVPVVAWLEGEHAINCIGTASIISCTGFLLTAAHVLMDPFESGYGAVRDGMQIKMKEDLNFGVLIPFWAPSIGMQMRQALRFFPIEQAWTWGAWKPSPLLHVDDRWEYSTDIAICKIPEMPSGRSHQPLNMSLNPFVPDEDAYALGYAEMPEIQLNPENGGLADRKLNMDLHVSVGEIMRTFSQNHVENEVSTPGPCFDFNARIPGKMSGAPIFGARGAVIRGVVSRSFSGEDHAFGSMLGPAMHLPLNNSDTANRTLATLLESGSEGMAKLEGAGL